MPIQRHETKKAKPIVKKHYKKKYLVKTNRSVEENLLLINPTLDKNMTLRLKLLKNKKGKMLIKEQKILENRILEAWIKRNSNNSRTHGEPKKRTSNPSATRYNSETKPVKKTRSKKMSSLRLSDKLKRELELSENMLLLGRVYEDGFDETANSCTTKEVRYITQFKDLPDEEILKELEKLKAQKSVLFLS